MIGLRASIKERSATATAYLSHVGGERARGGVDPAVHDIGGVARVDLRGAERPPGVRLKAKHVLHLKTVRVVPAQAQSFARYTATDTLRIGGNNSLSAACCQNPGPSMQV